jgi:hypothetical protein
MNTLRIVTVPQASELLPESVAAPIRGPAPGVPATRSPGTARAPARRRWLVGAAVAMGLAVTALALGVAAALGEPVKMDCFRCDLSGSRASGSAQVMSHRDGARGIVDSAMFVVDGRTETSTP